MLKLLTYCHDKGAIRPLYENNLEDNVAKL